MAQEKQITQLTGQSADQTWMVVYGDSAEQTLQRLEALAPQLAKAKSQQWLGNYRLLPLSSLAMQQKDHQLLQRAAPGVMAQLRQAGVEVANPDLSGNPSDAAAMAFQPEQRRLASVVADRSCRT